MAIKLCPTTGKRSYVRASAANKAAAFWVKTMPPDCGQTAQSAYRCRHCGRWHLTSWENEHVRAYNV